VTRVRTSMARQDDERFFLYSLADRLNKSVSEIVELPSKEIEEWRAFLELEAQRRELAEKQAKAKSTRRR
jgi:hypothetical protein